MFGAYLKITKQFILVTLACLAVSPVLVRAEPIQQNKSSLVQRIIDSFQRPRRPGRRMGGFCAASPGQLESNDNPESADYIVWSDRPVFVWDRIASRIIVRDDQGEEIWNQSVSPDDRAAIYNSSVQLQPDRVYEWTTLTALQTEPTSDQQFFGFQIMSGEQRDQIANDLRRLSESGGSPEAIALEQANYFIDREMWSDALQSL